MARSPVAELRVQVQGSGLVQVNASDPVHAGGDLRHWVGESPISTGAMVLGGLVLAAAGSVGATLVSVGLVGVVIFGGMMTVGGGLAFLGLLKRRSRTMAEPTRMLPISSSSTVVTERARRVMSVLQDGVDYTFEQLVTELRWTESALLETLVVMKESSQVTEDLDLETGEWVYRAHTTPYGSTAPGDGSMTLADRQVRGLHAEAQR